MIEEFDSDPKVSVHWQGSLCWILVKSLYSYDVPSHPRGNLKPVYETLFGRGGGPFFLLAAYFQGNLDKLLSYYCATKFVCQILLWRGGGGDKGLDVLRGLFMDLLI